MGDCIHKRMCVVLIFTALDLMRSIMSSSDAFHVSPEAIC